MCLGSPRCCHAWRSAVERAEAKPYAEGRFRPDCVQRRRNHNDPDDWIASPMTLAILAQVV